MTTDCLHRRKHKLRRNFPSFLEIQNSVIRIAKCESCNSAFQVRLFIPKTLQYMYYFHLNSRKCIFFL
jgi:hypothetical protein